MRLARWKHRQTERSKARTEPKTRWNGANWQVTNSELIEEVLGDDQSILFATRCFFAPSSSVARYTFAMRLFSADAAHMRWGTCTFYSLYGYNAPMGAFCLGHAILAGNEDSECWKSFFSFIHGVYPLLDQAQNTIVSDRDKGLLKAFCRKAFCRRKRLQKGQKKTGLGGL